jgi:hypothetical protein
MITTGWINLEKKNDEFIIGALGNCNIIWEGFDRVHIVNKKPEMIIESERWAGYNQIKLQTKISKGIREVVAYFRNWQ